METGYFQKKGAAIGFSFEQGVPEVLVTAKGFLVDKLLQIARENNITIYKNQDLAEILSLMNPGEEIPESLYRVMAEVLAYCYSVNTKFREKIESR